MKKLISCLVCFLAYCSVAEASYEDLAEYPKRNGTHHIERLINTINSGDREKVTEFITQHFAPSFRDQFPMDMHVGYILDMHSNHGKLNYHSVRRYQKPQFENEIVVIVRTARTESWRALSLFIAQDKPYKIEGLEFSPARIPSNIPKPGKLSLEQAVAELESYVTRMAKKDVFSGTVLLSQGDKVLFSAAHGQASKRFNVANNLQTKFNLGSMNKMFTSVAIMQLVEAGKLTLTDKLSKFADESWLPESISSKIEVQHLLTHSSGLGSYFNQTYMQSSKNNYRNLEDYKPLIINETLSFEPGTDNRYSNTGMFMLGVIIEKVSGQNYFDYIRENIYQPAKMTNTDSFEMDQPIANLAIGYERDPSKQSGWRNNLYSHVLKGGPAGGGFSTVEDLHQFALALTKYQLLSKKGTEAVYSAKPNMHSPYYGYGFGVRPTGNDTVVGHGGGFDGISSNLDIYLKGKYVSAVMSNYGGGSRPIESKIRELLSRVE